MILEELIAREEIRRTMAIYNTSGDRGRLAEMAETFTEDGILEVASVPYVGRETIKSKIASGIKNRSEISGPHVTFMRHNLTTSHIEFVSDSEAHCWTYFLAITDFGPDHAGVYVDKFKKCDDRWLIAHRRVKISWDSPTSNYRGPGQMEAP